MEISGKPRFNIKLLWFFGLVTKEIRKDSRHELEKDAECKPKLKDLRKTTSVFEFLRTKGMLGQITGLLKSILKRLKIKELIANFKLGLDNPADTGLLLAYMAPFSVFLNSFFSRQIRMELSFAGDAILEGSVFGAVRILPIHLIPALAGFAFSPSTVRAIKPLVLAKWRGK